MSLKIQVPTFDEWFEAKHLCSFEDMYCRPRMLISVAQAAHMRLSRDYMAEQLQTVASTIKQEVAKF